MIFQPVQADFFDKPTLELARELLGMLLVKETEAGITSGWIVETEAYIGPEDRAAHSYGNRRTRRTEVMFGPPGYAYMYTMHTHCLLNVVSGNIDCPEAVLIRAIEPHSGIEIMSHRRNNLKKATDMTNGPGKLTKAFGITMDDYGTPLFAPPLYIAEGRIVGSVATGPRIGIENTGEAKHYPWRFWEYGNPYVPRVPKNK